MKKFRIGYFADGKWSHNAFQRIIEDDSLEVSFIVPRIDTEDKTLQKFSEKYKIDYLHPVKINSEDFIKKTISYDCDLFVSMSFNQIFKKRIASVPRLKSINCHAGKLPFYRGRNILNWALINDEKEFGITVHFIDEGIDTGNIILQRTFPITDMDCYRSLLQVSHIECAEILYDAIKKIQNGTNESIEQKEIHPIGFYCGTRKAGDETINWNQKSREIFNFIRAISLPGPKSITTKEGALVSINKSRIIDDASCYKNTTGQLLKKTEEGFWVKTQDSFIEILEIESEKKLKVGDKLGS